MQIRQIDLPVSLHLPETYGSYAPSRSCTSSSDCFLFGIALVSLSLSYISFLGRSRSFLHWAVIKVILRTKVVHLWTDLSLKYFLKCFFLWFFFKSRSGLGALRSWKSAGSSSESAEHKATPKNSWLFSSTDPDFALWRALEGCECGWSELSVWSLFNDLDQENSLGGEWEERVVEKGISSWGGCWGV